MRTTLAVAAAVIVGVIVVVVLSRGGDDDTTDTVAEQPTSTAETSDDTPTAPAAGECPAEDGSSPRTIPPLRCGLTAVSTGDLGAVDLGELLAQRRRIGVLDLDH